MSILCLAKKSWYTTKIFSTACFSSSVSSVSVQSNRSRNFLLDSALSVLFNVSFSFSLFNSSKIRICIGVRSSFSSGFSFVGNQNVLVRCSGLPVPSSSIMYVVRSGPLPGITLRNALSTGLMNLDCSGVTTENSAICVVLLTVSSFSCVCYSDCYFLVNFSRH